MTLDEAKELFPEVSKEPPEGANGYIYVTYNSDKGLFYLGKKFNKGWLVSYYGTGKYPKQWKDDNINLEHWPIQWCYSQEELDKAEYDIIEKYRNYPDNVNLIAGGNGFNSGDISKFLKEYYKDHPEEKEKISRRIKERMNRPEYKEAFTNIIKEYNKNNQNPFLGKHHKQETKDNWSKIRAEKARKERVNFIPNTSELQGCANPRRKVMNIETGEIFNSISDAGRAYGKIKNNIWAVCQGKRQTAFGYHWKYIENP